jgi:D-sedoheptulose 7-phosphate isomerase
MSKQFLSGERMIDKLFEILVVAPNIYLCGNGGSAANAIHIANDWVSVGLRAQALVSDIATVTAIANDFGYHLIFSKQLEVFGRKGDVLVLLSGSGESTNILAAAAKAAEIGMQIVVITGAWRDPAPKITEIARLSFRVGDDMQDAEGAQLFIGHAIYKLMKGAA